MLPASSAGHLDSPLVCCSHVSMGDALCPKRRAMAFAWHACRCSLRRMPRVTDASRAVARERVRISGTSLPVGLTPRSCRGGRRSCSAALMLPGLHLGPLSFARASSVVLSPRGPGSIRSHFVRSSAVRSPRRPWLARYNFGVSYHNATAGKAEHWDDLEWTARAPTRCRHARHRSSIHRHPRAQSSSRGPVGQHHLVGWGPDRSLHAGGEVSDGLVVDRAV